MQEEYARRLMELAKEDRDFEILSVIAPGLQGEKLLSNFKMV